MKLDIGLLILRLWGGGLMLVAHGAKKLLGFSTMMDQFPDPIGVGSSVGLALAVFAEVVCALAILLGFKTRWASVPLLFTMLVAAFLVHGRDPWQKQEFALLYAGIYFALIFTGGGRFAVDHITLKPR
jgi:putative oxidoreductase